MRILRLKALGYSSTQPILEVRVQCEGCLGVRTFTLTLNQLRNVCEDYTVHRDAQNITVWIEGTTRLLKCPACNADNIMKVGVARSQGAVTTCRPDFILEDGWWEVGELEP